MTAMLGDAANHRSASTRGFICTRELDRDETLSFLIDDVVVEIHFIHSYRFACVNRPHFVRVAQIMFVFHDGVRSTAVRWVFNSIDVTHALNR